MDATWFRYKVLLVEAQGSGKVLNEEELAFLADPRVVEGRVTQTVITHNAAYQADNLDAYDSDCNDISIAQAIFMANFHIPPDAWIDLCGEELDFEKEINYLKQTLSEQIKEKETLTKTFNVFKNESKEKEDKNIDKEIAFEKKVKELDNIKAQQIRPMLYDGNVITKKTNVISIADSEETLMLEEESRSKMVLKQSDPMVLEKKVNVKPIDYAALNRLSEDFGKCFVPQALFDEQDLWLQNSYPITDQSASSPVKIEAPRELPKSVEITDLNAQLQEKFLAITSLENDLRKLKGKDIVDNAAQMSKATTIAPGLYKLDPIVHHTQLVRGSRSTKSSRKKYIDNTKNDRILQISSSTKKKDKVEDHSRIVEFSLNKTNCVVEPFGNANVQHSKLNTNSELMCVKCNSFMFDARHELCFLEFVSDMNASSKSKPVKKFKKKEEWKPTGKVFTKIGYQWRPTGRTFNLVGNVCPLTRITATNKVPLRKPTPPQVVALEPVLTKIYTRRPNVPNPIGSFRKPKIAKSMILTKRNLVHLEDPILQLLHLLLL
ncbi:hypothetical protein Tco_0701933 [Tanacetum coccineum]|uniref:Uncharacterized protein n=1 Tax=Tanacetum coccineum TaxID=301880 RepID=A0ABQ4XVC3_9ASTR